MNSKWFVRFMDLAIVVSSWSKDPDHKIGCVIVNPERRVIAMGYNGFPKGVEDQADMLEVKQTKRLHMIHAELNAILNANGNLVGSTIFVNRFPCHTCAGAIIQAGISRLVAPEPNLNHKYWGEGWKTACKILCDGKVGVEYVEGHYSNK